MWDHLFKCNQIHFHNRIQTHFNWETINHICSRIFFKTITKMEIKQLVGKDRVGLHISQATNNTYLIYRKNHLKVTKCLHHLRIIVLIITITVVLLMEANI